MRKKPKSTRSPAKKTVAARPKSNAKPRTIAAAKQISSKRSSAKPVASKPKRKPRRTLLGRLIDRVI
jgi:hypothetical protein